MDDLSGMNRRDLLARLMLLLGAAGAGADDVSAAANAPATLSAPQRHLLDAYADTLIPVTDTPGALAAGVPGKLATMYRDWASGQTRVALAGALDRLDAAALQARGQGFAALPPADRLAFLAVHDKAAHAPMPPPAGAPKGNPFETVLAVADTGYARLKQLVATLFYLSEAGLTHELVYEHVPGGWTASVKVTPDTRPAITFGAF